MREGGTISKLALLDIDISTLDPRKRRGAVEGDCKGAVSLRCKGRRTRGFEVGENFGGAIKVENKLGVWLVC